MKNKKNLLYTIWFAAIVVCVMACFFCLFFSACSDGAAGKETQQEFTVETAEPSEPAEQSEPTDPAEQSGTPAEQGPGSESDQPQTPSEPAESSVRLGLTADAGREYLDQITFLGDSTTYGIGVYYGYGYTELCPPSQVWTPASGTLTLSYYNIATIVYPETGEEIPIADAVARARPKYLLLTLGVNGISFMDEEWFINDYTALVENIKAASPDTKIILNSIYPVALSYPYQDDINNDKINAANTWIERIAENTGCRYLYSFEALVDKDGNLPEESQNGDGLHLTGEAFTTVMQYIRTHAYN